VPTTAYPLSRTTVSHSLGNSFRIHIYSTRLLFRNFFGKQTFKMATIIDGKKIAGDVRENIKKRVDELKNGGHRPPGLAVVLVGERKDSQTYVRMKKRAAIEAGFVSYDCALSGDVSQQEVIDVVRKYNADPAVDGILVQLPLPPQINEEQVLSAIDVTKDVDGLHPENVGNLVLKGRKPLFVSCTPAGCVELLDRTGVQIAGKHAVVMGRSNIVGLPVSLLLLERNATVTICHSQTKDLKEKVSQADILIAACGQPQIIKKDWIKPGAVVIDVGMNAIDNGDGGTKLVGDVHFDEVKEVASAITPVPGGVGPMTIAMLLQNTLQSAIRSQGLEKK